MQPRYRHILYALAACAVVYVYARYNPATSHWLLRCPVKLLTGWQCPGCGAQRFLHALLQGHFREALAYNYFLIPTLPYLAALCVAHLLPRGGLRTRFILALEHKAVIAAYIIGYFIWFVVRNVYHI